MSRPIAETPTLRGEDAIRFMEAMENHKPMSSLSSCAIVNCEL